MKILIATHTYPPAVNGAAYFTYRLANGLVGRRHDVSVVCPSHFLKNTVVNNNGVVEYGIHSIPLPFDSNSPVDKYYRASPLGFGRKAIQNIIGQKRPDVVHIQNHFMISRDAAIIAKKMDIPVMGTNHFMPENLTHYLHLSPAAEKWVQNLGWKQCIKVLNKLDCVATPTQTAANLLKQAGFKKEVIPVSNGIDLQKFTTANEGAYLRKRYSIPAAQPVLLYVGRLAQEKRIETILRALPEILRSVDAHLILAGGGGEKSKLEALTRKLDIQKAVTFAGFLANEDLMNVYRAANLFVIAGIAELQSIVTMEAMASGLPVLAVNAMALPELVHDGENGCLFPENDSHALAEKAIAILQDSEVRARMSQKSLTIIKNHDIRKTIEKYESLYNSIRKLI